MKRAAILLQDNLEKIVEAFSKGEVACIPTDTIYAMSCDAMNVDAIERIYQIKSFMSSFKFNASSNHVSCYFSIFLLSFATPLSHPRPTKALHQLKQ